MSLTDRSPSLDLSGHWHGLYSYPRRREPVPFSATLSDADGRLVGATEEIGAAWDSRGVKLTATLQGRREGRSVTFLKTYDSSQRGYDAVRYVGEVRDDGAEIEGTWTVPGSWSGRFLMVRSDSVPGAEQAVIAERV